MPESVGALCGLSRLRRLVSFTRRPPPVNGGARKRLLVDIQGVVTGRKVPVPVIDERGFELGADPGQSISGALTTERPGTYEFICSVPGHANLGMRGTITVRASG